MLLMLNGYSSPDTILLAAKHKVIIQSAAQEYPYFSALDRMLQSSTRVLKASMSLVLYFTVSYKNAKN